MKESMQSAGRSLARFFMTLIAIGLFLLAGVAMASAIASIAFGGLFKRLAGYETITGSIIAIGFGVSLLKGRPKKLNASTPNNPTEQAGDTKPDHVPS